VNDSQCGDCVGIPVSECVLDDFLISLTSNTAAVSTYKRVYTSTTLSDEHI